LSELKRTELTVRRERAILVGVILPDSTADPRDPLGELASLADTAGAQVVGRIVQRRQKVDPGTYIGSGKAIEIADLARHHKADVVIFDNDLSPGHTRRMSSSSTTICRPDRSARWRRSSMSASAASEAKGSRSWIARS